MFVRKACNNDIEALCRIYSESFESDVPLFSSIPDNIYVVCDEKIIGMCQIDYIDDVFRGKRIAIINSVCVAKKYRRKGVGTFMFMEIEKILSQDFVNEIMLTSRDSRSDANCFYRKLGYFIYDTNVFKKYI